MNSAIELMASGERPTEPGWYVVNRIFGPKESRPACAASRDILEVFRNDDGTLRYNDGTKLGRIAKRHAFIARIYPDRIEGMEG